MSLLTRTPEEQSAVRGLMYLSGYGSTVGYGTKSDMVMKSSRKKSKYMIIDPEGKWVHFGSIKADGTPYEQFKDRTPLKLYSKYDHNDPERRKRYLARHKAILTKSGKASYLDPWSPSALSIKYLW